MKNNWQKFIIITILIIFCIALIPIGKMLFSQSQNVKETSQKLINESVFASEVQTDATSVNDEIMIGENIYEEKVSETSAKIYEPKEKANSFFINFSLVCSLFIIVGVIYLSIKLVMA